MLRLTAAEAVDRALAESARVAGLRALEQAAAGDLQFAQAQRLPLVGFAAGYTRLSNVPELRIPVAGGLGRTIFPNLPDNYRTRLEGSVPVYTGGRLDRLIEAADEDRVASTKDRETAAADLILETLAAYWSLVISGESERVLAEALIAYDSHLRDARNRQRFGMAASNEVLAVQVERDRAELARVRAASASSIAQANLARLLNLPPGSRIEPSEALQPLASPHDPLEQLLAKAFDTRPERAALQSRIHAAEARVAAERGGRLPQLSAAAGYDYANPNRRILPPEAAWNDSWDVSINFTINLFDGGRTAAATARATARVEALKRQLEDLDRRIRLDVTERRLELVSAEEAVTVAERGLEAARENRRVSADRYREGLIPSSELLDAEVALLAAELDRTQALAAVHLARASLARAAGK